MLVLTPFLLTVINSCKKEEPKTKPSAAPSVTEESTPEEEPAAEEESEATDENPTSGKLAVEVNQLAVAYPQGLSVSALSSSVGNTAVTPDIIAGALVIGTNLIGVSSGNDQSATEHVIQEQKRLAGVTDCFSAGLGQNFTAPVASNVGCYVPDSGIQQGTNTDGQACLVAFAQSSFNKAARILNSTLDLMQGVICEAKKKASGGDSPELPAVGKSSDYTDLVNAAYTDAVVKFNSVSISRLNDWTDKAGKVRARYRFTVSAETTKPNGSPNTDNDPLIINMIHSASNDDNTNYDGSIWIQQRSFNNGDNKNGYPVRSLAYTRSGTADAPVVKYELRQGIFWKTGIEYFDGNGRLDFNSSADFSSQPGSVNYGGFAGNANDTISAMEYFTFRGNPYTNEAAFSFWVNPGGNYYENARGFVFEVTPNSDGLLTGCGVSGAANYNPSNGAGISIRRSVKEVSASLMPRGFYHPQGTPQTGSTLFKQCFSQDSSGKYIVDATRTSNPPGYDVIEASTNTVKTPDPTEIEVVPIAP